MCVRVCVYLFWQIGDERQRENRWSAQWPKHIALWVASADALMHSLLVIIFRGPGSLEKYSIYCPLFPSSDAVITRNNHIYHCHPLLPVEPLLNPTMISGWFTIFTIISPPISQGLSMVMFHHFLGYVPFWPWDFQSKKILNTKLDKWLWLIPFIGVSVLSCSPPFSS